MKTDFDQVRNQVSDQVLYRVRVQVWDQVEIKLKI